MNLMAHYNQSEMDHKLLLPIAKQQIKQWRHMGAIV
jgi:hypothetical protein